MDGRRVKECSCTRSGSCAGSGAGDWFVAASCLVAYEWEMCAWLMSSSLSSLRWQGKLEEEAPLRGLLLFLLCCSCCCCCSESMRNTMPRDEPASVTRLATLSCHSHWHLLLATCRMPLTAHCEATALRLGDAFYRRRVDSPHEKWSAKQSLVGGKTKSNILLWQKGKTKFINWVKSLENSPWQREQVLHAAWPWHWHAASSSGGLITRLPPRQADKSIKKQPPIQFKAEPFAMSISSCFKAAPGASLLSTCISSLNCLTMVSNLRSRAFFRLPCALAVPRPAHSLAYFHN